MRRPSAARRWCCTTALRAARCARRRDRAVVRRLPRQLIAARSARAGGAAGAGQGDVARAACARCSPAARCGSPARRAACRIRCRFAASRRCTARRCAARSIAREKSSSSSTARPRARWCRRTARCCPTAISTCPALALALDALRHRACACGDAVRRALHQAHVAALHRPAAAAHAPRSRAFGLRDDPEDADRAREPRSAIARIRRRSISCRCPRASRTTRRWRATSSRRLRDDRRRPALPRRDRAARRGAGSRPSRARPSTRSAAARARHTKPCARASPMLDEDRPLGPDIETIAAAFARRRLRDRRRRR